MLCGVLCVNICYALLRQFKRLLKTHLLDCLVFGTAALCDALVRSVVYKSAYLLTYQVYYYL